MKHILDAQPTGVLFYLLLQATEYLALHPQAHEDQRQVAYNIFYHLSLLNKGEVPATINADEWIDMTNIVVKLCDFYDVNFQDPQSFIKEPKD